MRDSWEGGRGDIQIVAIKDVYVHCKCTTSQLHIMYYIDIYNANNRLLNVFFLSQEKPQATVSDTQWTSTYRIKWKMNTCHVHLTLAAGYWDLLFFVLFCCFYFICWFLFLNPHDPPAKFRPGQTAQHFGCSTKKKEDKEKEKKKRKRNIFFPRMLKLQKVIKCVQ